MLIVMRLLHYHCIIELCYLTAISMTTYWTTIDLQRK